MSDKNQKNVLTFEDFFNMSSDDQKIETETEDVLAQQIAEEITPPKPEEEENKSAEEEEIKPEPKSQEEPPQPPAPSAYEELLKDYIEAGEWEDAVVEIDGEEIQLSELKGVDKDTFLQIKNTQAEIAKEKTKDKYVDVDGLDETTLKLIDIKKKGGDISSLLQYEVENIHPLQGLDLENENTQMYLLFEKYKSQGMDEEAAKRQLAYDKENFQLDTKAGKVIDEINNSYKAMVSAQAEEQSKKVREIEEANRELAKNVREFYKTFEIKETSIKRFTDTATKKDKQGNTKLDSLLEQAKKDPEKLAKLAFFLEDEKGFLEFNGAKQKNKQNLRTIKLVTQTGKKDKDLAKLDRDGEDKKDPWAGITFKKQ